LNEALVRLAGDEPGYGKWCSLNSGSRKIFNWPVHPNTFFSIDHLFWHRTSLQVRFVHSDFTVACIPNIQAVCRGFFAIIRYVQLLQGGHN